MESSKLCPVCGAYWKCDCKPEEIARVRQREVDRSALNLEPRSDLFSAPERSNKPTPDPDTTGLTNTGCDHDWSEALGVEVDDALVSGESQVMVCRLCGLYSVEERSA